MKTYNVEIYSKLLLFRDYVLTRSHLYIHLSIPVKFIIKCDQSYAIKLIPYH